MDDDTTCKICKICKNFTPPGELMIYNGRCEDCWSVKVAKGYGSRAIPMRDGGEIKTGGGGRRGRVKRSE